jgi:VanZ family protein
MKSTLIIICHYILVLFWLGLIFWMSSIPNLSPPADGFSIPDFLLKKTAHFVEYFILAVLLLEALLVSHVPFKKAIILSLFAAVIYAILDEWHQIFVIGRSGRVRDIVIDAIGAAAGLIFYYYYHFRKKSVSLK